MTIGNTMRWTAMLATVTVGLAGCGTGGSDQSTEAPSAETGGDVLEDVSVDNVDGRAEQISQAPLHDAAERVQAAAIAIDNSGYAGVEINGTSSATLYYRGQLPD